MGHQLGSGEEMTEKSLDQVREELKVGIDGLVAVLGSLSAIAVCASDVAKDGKVGIDDLSALVTLGKKYDVFVGAAKNFSQIPAEVKDLDKEELVLVLTKLSGVAMEIKNIFLK